MSNTDEYRITKNSTWFQLMGPKSSIDKPVLKSSRIKKLAREMQSYEEIMNAYKDGYLVFDKSISDENKQEVLEILNDNNAGDYFIEQN